MFSRFARRLLLLPLAACATGSTESSALTTRRAQPAGERSVSETTDMQRSPTFVPGRERVASDGSVAPRRTSTAPQDRNPVIGPRPVGNCGQPDFLLGHWSSTRAFTEWYRYFKLTTTFDFRADGTYDYSQAEGGGDPFLMQTGQYRLASPHPSETGRYATGCRITLTPSGNAKPLDPKWNGFLRKNYLLADREEAFRIYRDESRPSLLLLSTRTEDGGAYQWMLISNANDAESSPPCEVTDFRSPRFSTHAVALDALSSYQRIRRLLHGPRHLRGRPHSRRHTQT
jgi:hypothetical protein